MVKKFIKRLFPFIFKEKTKKIVVEELKSAREIELEKRLKEIEVMAFEEYVSSRMLVETGDGFQIKFLGEKIVRILSKCLYYLVKDSSNYLVFTFKNAEHPTGVDVYIVREGQLVSVDVLEELEEENKMLKEELRKVSN